MKYKPTTLINLLDNAISQYPADSLISAKKDDAWSKTAMDSFRKQINDFAVGLYVLGVRPGDRVSIHSENSTRWLICDLAVLSLGAVTIPVYTTQPGNQIRYILENSETKIHIVSGYQLFRNTGTVISSVKSIKTVISLEAPRQEGLKNYDGVLKLGQDQLGKEPGLLKDLKRNIRPESLATIIYTSGTTGTPKGVMLTHNNIASNIQASLERVPFTMEEIRGQNVLSYLPLSHIFERMITYMYLVMGARIHYIDRLDDIREDFLHVRPFFFATVPRLLEKIQTGIKLKGQEFKGLRKHFYYWTLKQAGKYDPENPPSGIGAFIYRIADKTVYSSIRELFGGNLRGMISGGAALSPDLFRFINAMGVYCGQGYGLTETSPVVAVQNRELMRIGSCGKALTDVKIKIAGDNEILVRGPNVMKGYYGDPIRTGEVITEDGWFKTGDVGRMDSDGYLFITDRKKALFKLSTGKYIAPQHVESQLESSGYIEQAVVIGYQKKFCSALIVPAYANVRKRLGREGHVPDEPPNDDRDVRELIQAEVEKVNKNLSPWEKVKKFTLLERPLSIESGELTPTLKIKKAVVSEKYRKEIEAMYEE